MGVYKKIGFRNIALKIIEFITWIRWYGVQDGCKFFFSLLTPKSGFFYSKAILHQQFKLRDNYSDRAIFLQVFLEKQYELYNKPLTEAAKIIDGGANIGASAVYFANLFPNATILAIEPEKNNYALLKENTEKYKNIVCLQAGIWHKNEFINISNPESLPAGFIVQSGGEVISKKIQGITINELLRTQNWNEIDILKLDIESAEKEVFSAADLEWLGKIKLLIIELHDSYKEGCTKAFFTAVNKYNYKAFFHHENIFIFFE